MNLQELNDEFINLFDSNKPFSIIRVGNTEGYFLHCFLNNETPVLEFQHWFFFAAGVYPFDLAYYSSVWKDINVSAIKNSNLVGFVDISEDIKKDQEILKLIDNKPSFFKQDIAILEPVYFLNSDLISNPWTKKLKNKKVLVVSSHENSIKHQWENIEKVWGNKFQEIAEFDLVDVIRCPFNPTIDDRQLPNCYTWDQTLTALQNKISEYDYDVLLVGAAAWSPALADFAKKSGKIGITICGAIQLFFGIIGSRWNRPEFQKFFNENWMYPVKEDLPQKREILDRFEKAYW